MRAHIGFVCKHIQRERNVWPKEENDDDMGFSLFD